MDVTGAFATPEAKPAPEADRVIQWIAKELVITVLQSLVLALVVAFVTASFGTSVHLLGTWAVSVVAILAIRLHRTAMPASARNRSVVRSVRGSVNAWHEERAASFLPPSSVTKREREQWFDPLPPTLERRFSRMYRHVDRLSYAVVETRHYAAGVRPVLAEIARDRLRRHHGIELDENPERARAILGEDVWRALNGLIEHPPTTEDLDRWLTQLERLDPERDRMRSVPG